MHQVRDDGPGVGCSDDEAVRLFEPFYSDHVVDPSLPSGELLSGVERERLAVTRRLRAT